jgi:hypothetical protein
MHKAHAGLAIKGVKVCERAADIDTDDPGHMPSSSDTYTRGGSGAFIRDFYQPYRNGAWSQAKSRWVLRNHQK